MDLTITNMSDNLGDLPLLLLKVSKNFNKEHAEFLKPYGLGKLHAFYLLCLVSHKTGLKLKQLNEKLGCDKANTSRAISDLEVKGIIQKEITKDCEKKYNVKLTEFGFKIAKKFKEIVDNNLNKMFSNLTDDELMSLISILKKMVISN